MGFKFRLEKVLQHRKTQENLAQKDFQDAQHFLNQQIDFLEKMVLEKTRARERSHSLELEGGSKGPALVQIYEYIKGQDIRIERQRETIKQAELIVENKREILRQAAIEYKIIEKLKEKKLEQYHHEENRKEQADLDEQVTMREGLRDGMRET